MRIEPGRRFMRIEPGRRFIRIEPGRRFRRIEPGRRFTDYRMHEKKNYYKITLTFLISFWPVLVCSGYTKHPSSDLRFSCTLILLVDGTQSILIPLSNLRKIVVKFQQKKLLNDGNSREFIFSEFMNISKSNKLFIICRSLATRQKYCITLLTKKKKL